jgi:hypothetical protein
LLYILAIVKFSDTIENNKDGDANSRYFHACIKARKRNNNILALRTPNGWVEGPEGVRGAVVTFFKKHFDKEEWIRPVLEGVVFPQISEEHNSLLVTIFTGEEIEAMVKSIDGSKCPGPDGFNFTFVNVFLVVDEK